MPTFIHTLMAISSPYLALPPSAGGPFIPLDSNPLRARIFAGRAYGCPTEERAASAPTCFCCAERALILRYRDAAAFDAFTRRLNVFGDIKAGHPRASYRGVLPFLMQGVRVLLVDEHFRPSSNVFKAEV